MAYVDFFCVPLPEGNLEVYKQHAEVFASVMKDFGMLQYCEAIADDVPRGKVTDFYRAVAAAEGETVVAAYVVWPDRATRDRAWAESMKDPRFANMGGPENMPFDGKRMFWGGFKPFLER
jgi:uncharacterized protein YbaA (DUF1428 family)